MRHDPEGMAAAYLGSELRRWQRERYEAHLLACDDWQELGLGRRGRALAESVRQVAPQRLRERVRATVEVTPRGGAACPPPQP
jgi:hypothetical protein